MVYTIKIQDRTKKAKSIINMLKALRDDYDFIEISEDLNNQIDKKINKELDNRYELFLKSNKGKDWNELKRELI